MITLIDDEDRKLKRQESIPVGCVPPALHPDRDPPGQRPPGQKPPLDRDILLNRDLPEGMWNQHRDPQGKMAPGS